MNNGRRAKESGKNQKLRRELMIYKIFKGILVILTFGLALACIGCSGSDDSTTSEQEG